MKTNRTGYIKNLFEKAEKRNQLQIWMSLNGSVHFINFERFFFFYIFRKYMYPEVFCAGIADELEVRFLTSEPILMKFKPHLIDINSHKMNYYPC